MYNPNQIPLDSMAAKPLFVRHSGLLVTLFHVAIFSICVTAKDFNASSFVPLFMGLLLSNLACVATLLYAKSAVPKFIAAFLTATFTAKLPLCLSNAQDTFLNVLPLKNKQLSAELCEKYFLFSFAFFAFAVGAVFASRFFLESD